MLQYNHRPNCYKSCKQFSSQLYPTLVKDHLTHARRWTHAQGGATPSIHCILHITASSAELSQQNEFKTRLIQPSLSLHGHRMHCNTPLIIMTNICMCQYAQYALKECIWNATKYLKLKKYYNLTYLILPFPGLPFPPWGEFPPG